MSSQEAHRTTQGSTEHLFHPFQAASMAGTAQVEEFDGNPAGECKSTM